MVFEIKQSQEWARYIGHGAYVEVINLLVSDFFHRFFDKTDGNFVRKYYTISKFKKLSIMCIYTIEIKDCTLYFNGFDRVICYDGDDAPDIVLDAYNEFKRAYETIAIS